MCHVRVLAVSALVIALVVLLSGLSFENTYSIPQTRQECVSSETFTMPANATTYRSIALNLSGTYHLIVSVNGTVGTVFSSSISEGSLEKWLQGQFNVSWDGNANGYNMFGVSGPFMLYPVEVSNDSIPNIQDIVFWNPETFSLQVNLRVYKYWAEIDYSNLSLGILLTAIGAVGILGTLAFFVVKNRAQVKNFNLTRKKALTLLVSVLMLASGVFLAYTYSSPVKAQTILAEGTLNVPAKRYQSIVYSLISPGDYYFQTDCNRGTVQVYVNGENSTVNHWPNGTEIPMPPVFNGSSGERGYSVEGDAFPFTQYLIFSNSDAFSKEVNYQVSFHWTYNNYFAMLAGIALTALGAITLFLTLLRNKLKDQQSS